MIWQVAASRSLHDNTATAICRRSLRLPRSHHAFTRNLAKLTDHLFAVARWCPHLASNCSALKPMMSGIADRLSAREAVRVEGARGTARDVQDADRPDAQDVGRPGQERVDEGDHGNDLQADHGCDEGVADGIRLLVLIGVCATDKGSGAGRGAARAAQPRDTLIYQEYMLMF